MNMENVTHTTNPSMPSTPTVQRFSTPIFLMNASIFLFVPLSFLIGLVIGGVLTFLKHCKARKQKQAKEALEREAENKRKCDVLYKVEERRREDGVSRAGGTTAVY
ncbi:hypothetical protein EJ04DRAFT_178224 [Polyplosphaeria fusca]|uniref:Uncharacterized protein n=1 Tax=Polyplosphaeria fusca TaxID=682080 RepID=A0A9P4V421_9PLEO|nr:hypothetical protein EJ04DRAFT_178224 [Polyplosphaeria fusca]